MSDSETSGREGKEEADAPSLPRNPPTIDHPITTATSSTQPTQYTTSVHFHSPEPNRGERRDGVEREGRAIAASEASMEMQQLREELARQQQLISDMLSGRTGNRAVDTYRSPISTSVKRAYQHPAAQRSLNMQADPVSPGRHREYDDDKQSREVGIGGMTLKDVIQNVGRYVTPFYADSKKDSNERTVTDFVENVESVLVNMLKDPQSPHRLMLVQLCLRDGALAWLNRKLQELTDSEKGWRDFNARPLSWDADIRRPFMQAFQGVDAAELWLTKLEALKLGEGNTLTPIELDNQFDRIARTAFPFLTIGSEQAELLLAPYYAKIVMKEKWLYTNILRSHGMPSLLRKWKQALSSAFIAEAYITARNKANSDSSPSSSGKKPGHKYGRGGGARSNPSEGKQQAVSAMEATDTEREEGQGSYEEMHQQLAALPANNQRGSQVGSAPGGAGRVGPNGRGRSGGGARQSSSQRGGVRQPRKCWTCGSEEHLSYDCPNTEAVVSTQQQSNE